jgi:hypothetical protein
MVAVLTNLQTLSDLGEATRAMLAGLRHTLLDGILGPSSSSTMDLGITNAATGFLIAALFYTLLSALFTWIWKLVDSSAVRDLTWRRTYGDLYIGRPMMLPETRKGEVRFTDFMLRLVPWLGASIAIVLAVPESESWIGAWYPSSGYPAAGQVLLLTILLAFADTIGSYWRRRGFVQQFESVPNATDSVAAAPGQDNRQDESTSQLN